MVASGLDFPRQQSRTRRFSLGAPRNFTVSPDGGRVVFLRSPAGDDPSTSLWLYATATGTEAEVASASSVLGGDEESTPPEERARRERSRELAGGIVGYACDEAVTGAAFALGGRLWWATLEGGGRPVELPSPGGVVDPRPAPGGDQVAFLSGPRLFVVPTDGSRGYAVLAEDGHPEVTWGAAEFAAAEEMGRRRGFWWAPDGRSLLATRVDNTRVTTWWTSDPSKPGAPPEAHKFPQAGTDDAVVSLWWLAVDGDGERRQVTWDATKYPYLAGVQWGQGGPPLLLVEQRDHKACAVLSVDLGTMGTRAVAGAEDQAWVDWPPGLPVWLDGGELLWAVPDQGTWRLTVDARPVTPPGLQVREVSSNRRSVLFSASQEPEVIEAWEWSPAGGLRQLTDAGGVSRVVGEGAVKVVASSAMSWHGVRAEVLVEGAEPRRIASRAETPVVEPEVHFFRAGPRRLSVGVVLPSGHRGGRLPVVMSPYGGPGHQQVVAARAEWLAAQWVADQGFAVVVADGRGTPGRGPAFEREVYRDLAGPILEDQVVALAAAAEEFPDLDLDRVGIRGWSFGGYLAALAVLSRPEVFHAAVAGAPVTEWRFYDTYYTEKYLGHPREEPEAYDRCSLLPLAPQLRRPLLIIQGLADDNVYAVHALALSSALLVAGRPHELLPLPGITHVASRDDISEATLRYEVEFLRRALGRP